MSGRRVAIGMPVLLSIALSACGDDRANDPKDKSGGAGVFMALYLVGSDLEDAFQGEPTAAAVGAGTDDLMEIADALSTLGDDAAGRLEVFVAFGGANKPEWLGVKWADGACLVEDAKDARFGNADCYAYSDSRANMSDPSVLAAFLAEVKRRDRGLATTIVDLWDHGAAYGGYGQDTGVQAAAGKAELLRIPAIAKAFADVGYKPELLYFDACLMASLEVAYALRDTAGYLLASEELIPGFGQDYRRMLTWLANNSDTPIEIMAARLIDTYLNGDSIMSTPTARVEDLGHNTQRRKTMSLVQLDQVARVMEASEAFFAAASAASSTTGGDTVFRVAGALAKFGVNAAFGVHIGYTVDLGGMARLWPQSAVSAGARDALQQALAGAVKVSKHDGTARGASGLAIFDPANADQWDGVYRDSVNFAGEEWKGLLAGAFQAAASDQISPTVQSETACTVDGTSAYCYRATDNVALSAAYGNLVFRDAAGEHVILIAPLTFRDGPDAIVMEPHDGSALWLCDGGCSAGAQRVLLPAYVGGDSYTGFGTLNGRSVTITVSVDPTTGEAVVELIEDQGGDPNGAKPIATLAQPGDTLSLSYLGIEAGALGSAASLVLSSGQLGATTAAGPAGLSYYLTVADLAGNLSTPNPQMIHPVP